MQKVETLSDEIDKIMDLLEGETQPVKLGGLGLRSLVETCPAAFVGRVEMAIPHME